MDLGKRLEGRVVLVTGGGSGLGRGAWERIVLGVNLTGAFLCAKHAIPR